MIKRLIYCGFFVVVMAVIFWSYLNDNTVLMTTDAVIKSANISRTEVIHRIVPHWQDAKLLGAPLGAGTQFGGMLKLIVNGVLWNNVVYGLACLLASCAFLRYFKWTKPWIACLGALSAFWFGTNFTLMYGGHVHKAYIVFLFVCSLLPVAGAVSGSVLHALIWGGCVGLMFVQQPDVALFFALFSGTYLVYRLCLDSGFSWKIWLKVLVPAAAFAFLFAVGPLLSGYQHHVKGTAQMESNDPTEKWDYITQWSMPPDELGMLVAPGYFGWRSGEAEGPYWGRIGQTPGWEQHHQGMRNFKLDDGYLGLVPIVFAVFASIASFKSDKRREVWFWSGAAAVALLLAMGRYSPVYRLFYHLPVVNNIRAPIKFMQVFQVCVAILAAYGVHFLFSPERNRKSVRIFFWGMVAVSGVFLLMLAGAALGMDDAISALKSGGWPPESAAIMAENKVRALGSASFMSLVVTAVVAAISFVKPAKSNHLVGWLGALLVMVVAVDAVRFSRHYIKEMPRSYIASNALTDFLKNNLGDERVALLSQQGIDNIWITYSFPYNGILCFNFTDMPRMQNDYKALLSAGQKNPLNMWRFSAVKYLLAPSSMAEQLNAAGCRKVFSYALSDAGHGEFKLMAHPQGPLSVYQLAGALPRYGLFAGSQNVPDEQALTYGLQSLDTVYLPEKSGLPVLGGVGQVGEVDVLSYRPGKVRLKTVSDVPAILRVAEKYDPDWRASVDGKPVEVGRVDYLCQGISVPPGEHEVELRYAPSKVYFYVQCLGMLILVGALVKVFLLRRKHHVAD